MLSVLSPSQFSCSTNKNIKHSSTLYYYLTWGDSNLNCTKSNNFLPQLHKTTLKARNLLKCLRICWNGEPFADRIMLQGIYMIKLRQQTFLLRTVHLFHPSCFRLGELVTDGALRTPAGGVWGLLARKSSAFNLDSESHCSSAWRELWTTELKIHNESRLRMEIEKIRERIQKDTNCLPHISDADPSIW